MILIPEPPRPPLSAVGDMIEGRITWAEPTTDQWGNTVLKIGLETTNGPMQYTCNRRLWALIGGGEVSRIRITRIEDSPAVGNKSPARNWTVEKLPDLVAIQSPPQPTPQRTTTLTW